MFGFVADFYCHAAGVVVELDGPVHDLRREDDEKRTRVLESNGLIVLRFDNESVLHETDRALEKIRNLCQRRIADASKAHDLNEDR